METKFGFTKMNLAEFDTWINKLRVGRTVLLVQQHHTWNPSYKLFNGSNHFDHQRSMKNHHVAHNGWADIGQHFTTFPDGTIVTGRSLELTPACLKGANSTGICMEHFGNFDKGGDTMTPEHKDTIVKMTAILCKRFGIPVNSQKIVYHHWYDLGSGARNNGTKNNKSCPGTNFFGGNKVPDCEANFLPLVRAILEDKGETIDESFTPNLLKYVAVNTASLNVRKKPDASSDKVTDRDPVTLGAILRVFKEKNGWLKISDSKNHWISGRFTLDVRKAVVTANSLNIRSSPEIKPFNVTGSASKGQTVFIEAEQAGWCKLIMENKWVSKDFLDFE